MRRLVHPSVFGLVLLMGTGAVMSQAPVPPSEPSGLVLNGTVSGPDGEALPGVTVTIVDEVTGWRQAATTDATGTYRIRALPGRYQVVAEMAGFDKVTPGSASQ